MVVISSGGKHGVNVVILEEEVGPGEMEGARWTAEDVTEVFLVVVVGVQGF